MRRQKITSHESLLLCKAQELNDLRVRDTSQERADLCDVHIPFKYAHSWLRMSKELDWNRLAVP